LGGAIDGTQPARCAFEVRCQENTMSANLPLGVPPGWRPKLAEVETNRKRLIFKANREFVTKRVRNMHVPLRQAVLGGTGL
jgi:hypothetical protein